MAIVIASTAILPASASALDQRQIVSSDGTHEGLFGRSLAVSGNLTVVGAPGAAGFDGAAYVFEHSAAGWTQVAELTASDGSIGDQFGTAVAIDGEEVAVGAPRDDIGPNANQGSVYTFAAHGAASRTETAKLTASGGEAQDLLGSGVAVAGGQVVVGAPNAKVAGHVKQGAAYTFAASGGTARNETAKLIASDGAEGDEFGWALASSADEIVVGAALHEVEGHHFQGAAYTFTPGGGSARTESAELTSSDGAEDDEFGGAVAIDAEQIVVTAPEADPGSMESAGAAYTFTAGGSGNRTETAKLTASDGTPESFLGSSVAIDNSQILVGVSSGDVGADVEQGYAYVFDAAGSAGRTETAKLTDAQGAGEDHFGSAVAIAGDELLVGAPDDDVGSEHRQGTVVNFFVPSPPAPRIPTAAPDKTAPDTRITKRPPNKVMGAAVTYRFAGEPGAGYQCSLDKKKFRPCRSPLKLEHLKPGKHTFRVRAIDAAGNVDPSPAKDRFQILSPAGPST